MVVTQNKIIILYSFACFSIPKCRNTHRQGFVLFCLEKSALRGKRARICISFLRLLLASIMRLADIQSRRLIHLFLNQFKTEQAEILQKIIRIQCAKNQCYDVMTISAEDDLLRRNAVRSVTDERISSVRSCIDSCL